MNSTRIFNVWNILYTMPRATWSSYGMIHLSISTYVLVNFPKENARGSARSCILILQL